eukprot:m.71899 g.71899  ORF g.71899 m.71899 type:complete len:72 (-) comp50208_c0_seq8:153-368(-)
MCLSPPFAPPDRLSRATSLFLSGGDWCSMMIPIQMQKLKKRPCWPRKVSSAVSENSELLDGAFYVCRLATA